MRVIGQSSFTKVIPYNHLGYTAATTTIRGSYPTMGGIIAIAIGVLLAMSLTSAKMFAGRGAPGFRRRHRTVIVTAGILLILGGVGWLVFVEATAEEREVYVDPGGITRMRAWSIVTDIWYLEEKGNAMPSDFSTFAGRDGRGTTDGWFNEMRFEKTRIAGKDYCIVTSAGPDTTFDTDDDMKYTIASFRPELLPPDVCSKLKTLTGEE